jgi:hypothetical protein
MFKDVLTLWNRYSDTLDKDSQQWSRSGEVEERLVQLDLTLGYLKRALTAVSKDSSSWAAWARVVLFTETFYLVAWRLRVVLRSKGALAWPGLGMLPRDDAITFVRNHLIEHPEGNGGPYARYLTVIDDGPILKTVKTVVDPESGKEVADPESKDKGVFVNARAFHDAIIECLEVSLT